MISISTNQKYNFSYDGFLSPSSSINNNEREKLNSPQERQEKHEKQHESLKKTRVEEEINKNIYQKTLQSDLEGAENHRCDEIYDYYKVR